MSSSAMFPVADFFEIKKGKRLTKADMVPGDIPFVGSSAANNGITAYIGNDSHLHDAGTITVSYNGSVGEVFLQDEKFWASDDVNVWYPRRETPVEVKLYFMAAIKKLSAKYSYTNKWTIDKMRSELVELPIDTEGKPDFEHMQERIAELEQERIAELEQERIAELDAYLVASGLDDYELTDEDKEALSLSSASASDEADATEVNRKDERVMFRNFPLREVFDIRSPRKRFNANSVRFGGWRPYVARGSSNNGIKGFITEDEQYLSPARSLSFGQDTATVFYQPSAYFTGDKIKVMVLKDRDLTEEVALFFITAIRKAFSTFNWGQSSFNEAVLKARPISLPVTPGGGIDYAYMERCIRAVKKLAIADVAKYKDEVIKTTRQVVDR